MGNTESKLPEDDNLNHNNEIFTENRNLASAYAKIYRKSPLLKQVSTGSNRILPESLNSSIVSNSKPNSGYVSNFSFSRANSSDVILRKEFDRKFDFENFEAAGSRATSTPKKKIIRLASLSQHTPILLDSPSPIKKLGQGTTTAEQLFLSRISTGASSNSNSLLTSKDSTPTPSPKKFVPPTKPKKLKRPTSISLHTNSSYILPEDSGIFTKNSQKLDYDNDLDQISIGHGCSAKNMAKKVTSPEVVSPVTKKSKVATDRPIDRPVGISSLFNYQSSFDHYSKTLDNYNKFFNKTHYIKETDKFIKNVTLNLCDLKFPENPRNEIHLSTTKNPKSYHFSWSDFKEISEIGQGNFGAVFKVKHVPSGHWCAVKRIRSNFTMDQTKRKTLLAELNMVIKFRNRRYDRHQESRSKSTKVQGKGSVHGSGPGPPKLTNKRALTILDKIYTQNIVDFYGAGFSEGEVCIVMELMQYSLDDLKIFIFNNKHYVGNSIPEPVLKRILLCMVRALNYLKNELKIIHRDVKPSNMLINLSGQVKLCDFGISGQLVESCAKSKDVGCHAYMAPERIHPDSSKLSYGVKSDVWSLGVSMYELSTGEFPFEYAMTDIFDLISSIVEKESPSLYNRQTNGSNTIGVNVSPRKLVLEAKKSQNQNTVTRLSSLDSLGSKIERFNPRSSSLDTDTEGTHTRRSSLTNTIDRSDRSPILSEQNSSSPTSSSRTTTTFLQQNQNISNTQIFCYSKKFTQIIDYMMTKNVDDRPDYTKLLSSEVLIETSRKEGFSGAVDTRNYFCAIIEEMKVCEKIDQIDQIDGDL